LAQNPIYMKPPIKVLLFISTALACLSSQAQTSDSYNDLAKEAFDKKNYDLCIEYCNKSISASPNGWAYWERAASYYNLAKYDLAASDYASATSYYSSDNTSLAKLYFFKGESDYLNFRYSDALTDFANATTYGYSDYKYLYWYRGNAYYFTEDYSKAESDFTSALYYYNDNPKEKAKLYRFRADTKTALKNSDGALEDYTSAIETNPGDGYAYESRATLWKNKGDYSKAKDDITRAIKYKATDELLGDLFLYKLYQDRSLYNYYLRNYEEGIKDAQEALKTDSSMTTYWHMGLNYAGLRKSPSAIEAYKKAISKTKDSSDKATLYRNISLVYRKDLDYRSALREINIATGLNKKYRQAYWTRAQINSALKQYAAALNDYDFCISLYANDKASLASIYKERAELEFLMKDFDRASYDYNKLLEFYPDDVSYVYNSGRFLIQSKKDVTGAKQKFEKAIELDLKIDTCSDYSYAQLFLGNTSEAVNNMFRLIDKYRLDTYQYKWELHMLACIYALAGNSAKALEYLDKSMAAGFDDYDHLINDRDLVSISKLPQYTAILTKYKVPHPKL